MQYAHNLKGSAGNIGIRAIADSATTLEQNLRGSRLEQARKNCTCLKGLCTRFENAYRSYLEKTTRSDATGAEFDYESIAHHIDPELIDALLNAWKTGDMDAIVDLCENGGRNGNEACSRYMAHIAQLAKNYNEAELETELNNVISSTVKERD
jgi:HPt (histidine-containing phosphotransfer) domain-containing protein